MTAPEGPRFRSRFGGLWTDLSNARALIDGKRRLGLLDDADAERLVHWNERGWVHLPGAVPSAVIDAVNADVDAAWDGALPGLFVEHWPDGGFEIVPARPDLKPRPAKLLDLHAASAAARQAAFAPALLRFLLTVFERPALAFQSLTFLQGSRQPIHQDTAYVVVSSPLEFAAAWIALEDIQEGTGELEYYDGSHRLPEFLFGDGRRNVAPGDPAHDRYLQSLHDHAARLGMARLAFLPRRGDVLLWSADLAHGGATVKSPGASRRSLVVHYCPAELDPGYFAHAAHTAKLPCGDQAFYCAETRG